MGSWEVGGMGKQEKFPMEICAFLFFARSLLKHLKPSWYSYFKKGVHMDENIDLLLSSIETRLLHMSRYL
jgi:hypothetical protein